MKQRRIDKGNLKELNPANTISHHGSTIATMEKFKQIGADVRWIRHKKDPVLQISRMLDEDSFAFENSYREEKFR